MFTKDSMKKNYFRDSKKEPSHFQDKKEDSQNEKNWQDVNRGFKKNFKKDFSKEDSYPRNRDSFRNKKRYSDSEIKRDDFRRDRNNFRKDNFRTDDANAKKDSAIDSAMIDSHEEQQTESWQDNNHFPTYSRSNYNSNSNYQNSNYQSNYPSKHNSKKEMKYYGFHACKTLFAKRPQDIIRVYLTEDLIPPFSNLLKWCSKEKKAYHLVPREELEKITESIHHENICILAFAPIAPSFSDLLDHLTETSCLIYLDGVQNPHNLGSILRIAAHFGVRYILGSENQLPSLSAAACRIAQGGAESVQLIPLHNPYDALEILKKENFSIIATSSHAKKSLYKHSLASRTLFIFGAEDSGISAGILKKANDLLLIPGSNQIESLNVSLASSICLSEYFRQHCMKDTEKNSEIQHSPTQNDTILVEKN